MHSVFVKGLKGEAKEKRVQEIRSYKNAFNALKEILENDFEESVPDYTSPSWAYKQADVNGANRKLQQILKLLTIEEK